MLFSIKKKEKKIFGTELSDTTRSILRTFAFESGGDLTLDDEQLEVICGLPDFREVPDEIIKKEYEQYAKIVRRRWLIKSIFEIVFETIVVGYTCKKAIDRAFDKGVEAGAKETLNTPALKELRKDIQYRIIDDMYHEAQQDGISVITCNHDGETKEYLVTTIQDTYPEIKKEA